VRPGRNRASPKRGACIGGIRGAKGLYSRLRAMRAG
jgi:hypothetical protein